MPANKFVKIGVAALLLFISTMQLNAQSTVEVGAFGGASYYLGDINPNLHFKQLVPAYGLVMRYSKGTRFAFRFSLSTTELTGNDSIVKFNAGRELNFKTKVNDAAFMVEFNFFEYFTGSKLDYITPYIFGGISVYHFTPRDLNGNLLRPLGTEGQFMFDQDDNRIGPEPYSQIGVSVPFGLGIKYSLTKRLGLTVEWRMHKTFSDYLDDISTVYPPRPQDGTGNTLPYPPQVDPTNNFDSEMQRGDTSNNDWYSFTGVSLTYKFNLIKRDRCLDMDRDQNW